MRPMLFIRDAENLDGAPILASGDPVLLGAVGRLIAKHLAGTEALALPPLAKLRPIRREHGERKQKET